ncbi:hypothetical protein COLO4_15966 [Corchorus olitorius]|uniref:Leucine-rich repeat-containing N-terminal plant-type domain-containing protein n=1 Tax=Corchorus olitorius TaxID=93759 RepID=A0A1R3JKG7_9ROSI|nr:hypothetical protein COLO4_15966 [Corchorus olitorius]
MNICPQTERKRKETKTRLESLQKECADYTCSSSLGIALVSTSYCALLRTLKLDIEDHANRLASWSDFDEDCCGWEGVVCDKLTGHVIELHLGNPQPFLDDYATAAEFEAIDEMSKLRAGYFI